MLVAMSNGNDLLAINNGIKASAVVDYAAFDSGFFTGITAFVIEENYFSSSMKVHTPEFQQSLKVASADASLLKALCGVIRKFVT